MVQVGAAYVYRQYLKQCDRDSYLRAEDTATKKGLGVWGPYKPAKFPGNTAVQEDNGCELSSLNPFVLNVLVERFIHLFRAF